MIIFEHILTVIVVLMVVMSVSSSIGSKVSLLVCDKKLSLDVVHYNSKTYNSKIVSSIYNKSFEGSLSKKTIEKIQFDGIEEDISHISSPDFNSLTDLMIKYSDSVTISSDKIDKSTLNSIKLHSKDSLSFKDSSNDEKLMEFLLKNID